MLVTATSDQDPTQQDAIQAITTVPDVQPDLWIKRGADWIGDDICNDDGTDQYARRRVDAGATAKFYARMYNDGAEAGDFRIKHLSPEDPDYTVEYYWGTKLLESRKVTQWVMRPQGWKLRNVPAGGLRQFIITVTPNSGAASGSTYDATIRAEADADPLQRDTIQGIVRVK